MHLHSRPKLLSYWPRGLKVSIFLHIGPPSEQKALLLSVSSSRNPKVSMFFKLSDIEEFNGLSWADTLILIEILSLFGFLISWVSLMSIC